MTKRYFFSHWVADVDLRELGEGEYAAARNIQVSTDGLGKGSVITLCPNTVEVPIQGKPVGDTQLVGWQDYQKGQATLYFLANDQGDHVLAMHPRKANEAFVVAKLGRCHMWNNGPIRITESGMLEDDLVFLDGAGTAFRVRVSSTETTSAQALGREAPSIPMLVSTSQEDTYPADFLSPSALVFSYRYRYTDGSSVVGPWSLVKDIAPDAFAANTATLRVPGNVVYPIHLKEVEILYRILGDTHVYSLRTLSGKEAKEGVTFRNDQSLNPISTLEGTKLFESIPVYAKTLEVIESRCFMANIQETYPSSPIIDLTLTELKSSVSGQQNTHTLYGLYRWLSDEVQDYEPEELPDAPNLPTGLLTRYVLVDGLYYEVAQYYPDTGTVVLISGANGHSKEDLEVNHYEYIGTTKVTIYEEVLQEITDVLMTDSPPSGQRTYKALGRYQIGIVFMDFLLRSNGVLTSNNQAISIGPFDPTLVNKGIEWTIDPNQKDKIPTWATHYAIVATDNLATDFFLQGYTTDIAYINSQEEGSFGPNSYDWSDRGGDFDQVALDISGLNEVSIGYVYEKGDLILLFEGTYTITAEILGQRGTYLLIAKGKITPKKQKRVRFEINRPKAQGTEAVFFERGQVYPINEKGSFSVTNGVLPGDCFLVQRNCPPYDDTYDPVGDNGSRSFGGEVLESLEAMSPNDDQFHVWHQGYGRPHIILDNAGQVLPTGIRFSNPYLNDKVYGLDVWDAQDKEEQIRLDVGQIISIRGRRRVLSCIHENGVTSLYLFQEFIRSGTEDNLLSKTENVIGQIYPLFGEYGCLHPESVEVYRGQVFFWDSQRGELCRLSKDGIEALGMREGISSVLKKEALNRTDIYTALIGYDPFQGVVYLSLGATSTSPAITYGFSTRKGKWVGSYDLAPNLYGAEHHCLVSCTPNGLYKHDGALENNFYGTTHPSSVQLPFYSSEGPVIFESHRQEGTGTWLVNIITHEGQESFIPLERLFRRGESEYFGEFLRDIHTDFGTSNLQGRGVRLPIPLLEGKELKSTLATITLTAEGGSFHKLTGILVDGKLLPGYAT